MGLEIWLTARIRNYLSRYVVGGSRHVGGIGLMLAAISWTDRADWHGVFVSGSSERESVGLQQLLQPNPALLFSQGLRGSCEGCQLSIVCSAGTGRQKERVWFFFLCRKVHFSGIPLFLVFKWRLAIILLSLFLPPYSLSALLSFFLCYKLWGMRRERGKIKANPHTLPSNIIRLSLMALLEFLPCTCVWFCVHVQCYPCLFMHSHACLFLCQCACVRAHLRLDVRVATTCSAFLWHEAQCCHWAAMPSALAYWARRPNAPSAKCMWELPTVWCHYCFVELFPKQFLTVQSYIVAERIKKQCNRKEKKKPKTSGPSGINVSNLKPGIRLVLFDLSLDIKMSLINENKYRIPCSSSLINLAAFM